MLIKNEKEKCKQLAVIYHSAFMKKSKEWACGQVHLEKTLGHLTQHKRMEFVYPKVYNLDILVKYHDI
jgi:hypothetical protein